MRVLFSNPPWWESPEAEPTAGPLSVPRWRQGVRAGSRWPFTYAGRSRPDLFVAGDYLPYPFFMGYAATYAAEKTSHDVVLRDSVALKESDARFDDFVEAGRFDYVFLESASPSFEHDRGVIRRIRERSPASRIVLTGPVASMGEALLSEHGVHAVIQGEYEKGSVRVLEGESGVIPPDLLTVDEMNAAPLPWYDDATALRYYDANPKGQRFPHAQIWASRGCPFKCIFCVWPATMTGNDPDGRGRRTVRHYRPEYIERLVRSLLERYRFESIYFDDDTFNLGDRHTRAICAVMKSIGIPWSAMCRADTIQHDTWGVMKESGCFGVKLGFESGSQYVVDAIVNKHLDLEAAQQVVWHIQSLGMSVHGTFTFGLPGETKEQMRQTLAFIEETGFDTVQRSGTAEIEGTPLATLRRKGELAGFAGARMDEGYDRQVDGNKKWQRLIEELREK